MVAGPASKFHPWLPRLPHRSHSLRHSKPWALRQSATLFHCFCLQVQGEGSTLTIQNLYNELNHDDFPDQVNEPTLARLNLFLKGAKLPLVHPMTVRALVRHMLKMGVPDVCLCWRVFENQCMANNAHLSEEERSTKRVLELQRVVANCSEGVFRTVQEAYGEHVKKVSQGTRIVPHDLFR